MKTCRKGVTPGRFQFTPCDFRFVMDINIEFIGFPTIYDLFPGGAHPYTLRGETLLQLMEDLIERNDERLRESLLDPGTKSLDPTIQIIINGRPVPRDQMRVRRIEEGDQITFMKLLAGG